MSSTFQISVPYSNHCTMHVDFSLTRHQRENFPNAEDEAKIDTIWKNRISSNPSLFNATKFRQSCITLTPDQVTFHLGLTDYRTYLGTHDSQPHSRVHRSLTLGNVIIVVTSDFQVPFILRSAIAGDLPFCLALPGGHPEPSEIPNLKEHDNERVKTLLFKSARDETLEELFLNDHELCSLDSFQFLGAIDRMPDGKPCMAFLATTKLSANQVMNKYKKGNTTQEESTQILFKNVNCIRDIANGEYAMNIDSKSYQFVPETLGAAVLWCQKEDYRD